MSKAQMSSMITVAEFRAAQRRLRAQGNPEDPCGRCG